MRKVPGTLYHFGITSSKDNTLEINIWYRSELTFEKTGILKEEIINTLQKFFESKNLSIPSNRLSWIVKEELNDLSPTSDITFIEGTVSEILGEYQKKPSENLKKIVLMGLSNAGKTCIYERVFEGKKPWELMQSTATKGIDYKEYEVGSLSKPMIWDLGGQQQYLDEYHGALRKTIFQKASVLLYVIDASDSDRFENARVEFEWSVNQVLSLNKSPIINVFLHKIDLIHDKDVLISYLKNFLSQNISYTINFYATSVFDESLFTAWSGIIRDISTKSVFINSILKSLKDQEGVKDALLIEKTTGLACGSTLNGSNEDIVIGMVSLLIVTCDRVTKKMKLQNFKEFRLRTSSNYLLLTDVTSDLMLVIILDSSAFNDNRLKDIEEVGKEATIQIRDLWKE
ncbi:MAG: ADP-ribosylation factor-like protein [Promethearchaeota archaeon]|jgi:Ras-related GTP-binding protein A/B